MTTGKRILLVEDDDAHAELVCEAFLDEGGDVELQVAGTLAAARAILASTEVDLVISDLRVPDGRGIDLLLEHGSPPAFPLVVMTAQGDERVAVEAMKAGALDYVVKSPATFAAMPHIAAGALREWRQITRLRVAEAQLRHADRLITVGRIAAGLAHEVGTPLNIVRMRAQLLQMDGSIAPATRTSATDIVDQVDRVTGMIRQMLDFARARSSDRRATDLVALVRRALDLLGPTARKARVEVEVVADAPVSAVVDASEVQQVLFNLATNAIHAMPKGGRLTVTVDRDGEARIAVRDTGCGVAPEHLRDLFEPFFTTKEAGQGTGLGLAVCQGIVRDHDGRIEVESEPGAGSTFTVCLP